MKHRLGRRPCLPLPRSLQPSRLLGSPFCHPVPLSQLFRERHRQNLGVHSTKPSWPMREVWGGHWRQLSHLSRGFIIHTQCLEKCCACLLWDLTKQSSHIYSVISNTSGQPFGERSDSCQFPVSTSYFPTGVRQKGVLPTPPAHSSFSGLSASVLSAPDPNEHHPHTGS